LRLSILTTTRDAARITGISFGNYRNRVLAAKELAGMRAFLSRRQSQQGYLKNSSVWVYGGGNSIAYLNYGIDKITNESIIAATEKIIHTFAFIPEFFHSPVIAPSRSDPRMPAPLTIAHP
jgi:hypothetical protein